MTGKVILAGAGPGDPGLITLKAKYALERADTVLYDYLAHPNLLKYCKPTAELINVGKRKGHHSQTQNNINALMVKFASEGKVVVRLKGGDPCVFGRIGEEMECLTEHHIPFEIIPGVTSAIAVPAYAGIPITQRELSRSFAVVTASAQEGDDVGDIHIPNAETLIFLMPVTQLDLIAQRVIKEISHFSTDTPAALIYKGTTASQKTILGTLGTIVALKDQHQLTPPAILVVGKVAGLTRKFNWTETLPLFGKRIVLLRTAGQGQEWVNPLSELGAEVIQLPMIEIVPNQQILTQIHPKEIDRFSLVVFTSPNGVKQWMTTLFENGYDARTLAKQKIAAIGSKTAALLKEFGIIPDILPEDFSQEGLLDTLPVIMAGETILIATAAGARETLPKELIQRGATVEVWKLYDTKMPDIISNQEINNGDWIIFTSSSTVTHFFESKLYNSQPITAFCIGKSTEETLKQHYQGPIIVSPKATIEATISVLLNHAGEEKK